MVKFLAEFVTPELLRVSVEDPYKTPMVFEADMTDPAAQAAQATTKLKIPSMQSQAKKTGTEQTDQTKAGAVKQKLAQTFTDKLVLRPQDIQAIKSKPGFKDMSSVYLAQRDFPVKQFNKFPLQIKKGDAFVESSLQAYMIVDAYTGKQTMFTIDKKNASQLDRMLTDVPVVVKDDHVRPPSDEERLSGFGDKETSSEMEEFLDVMTGYAKQKEKDQISFFQFFNRVGQKLEDVMSDQDTEAEVFKLAQRLQKAIEVPEIKKAKDAQLTIAKNKFVELLNAQIKAIESKNMKLFVSSKAVKATKGTSVDLTVNAGQKVPTITRAESSLTDARTNKPVALKVSDIVIESQFQHFLLVRAGGQQLDWWVFVSENEVSVIENNCKKTTVLSSADAAPFSELATRAGDMYTKIFRDQKFPTLLDIGKWMITKNKEKQAGG